MNEKKKLSSISKQNKTRKTKKEKGERVGFFSGGRGDGQNLLFCPKFQIKILPRRAKFYSYERNR